MNLAGVVFNVRMYSYIFILWEMCDCLVLQGVLLNLLFLFMWYCCLQGVF